MDPKLSPGLSIATKCSIVDPLGPLYYMSTKISLPVISITLDLDFLKISIQEQVFVGIERFD